MPQIPPAEFAERRRELAHVGSVELFTADPVATTAFFTDLMGMERVAERGGSVYVHAWDDYELFTVKITERDRSGIGRTYLRAASPQALQRVTARLPGGRWVADELGLGDVYLCQDPDGHDVGVYFDTEWYEGTPALKNQAAPFPGRGANIRRLDHVNYLAADMPGARAFLTEGLGARPTEQIMLDSGEVSAFWTTVSDKSYDLVTTHDSSGVKGRLHHVAFAADTRDDILRAADVFLEAGIHIETGPHKHAIQQTFFLYVYEPGGNRIELCNAGARLMLAPDWQVVTWTEAERARGQAWGLKTIESFHRHGTPPVDHSGS